MDCNDHKSLERNPSVVHVGRVRQGSFVSQQRWATESLTTFSLQVLLPFLICGFGNIGAGQLLEHFQHREVFVQISELIILVPSLMGLKGNLEMTLASRLSTAVSIAIALGNHSLYEMLCLRQANCGVIDSYKEIWMVTKGNVALLQCQATVVGFLAAMFAIAADALNEKPRLDHIFVVITSSLLTSNIAGVFLSSFLIAIVILCRSINVNPDNVATPIASSLGDVITVALLAFTSHFTFTVIKYWWWWTPLLCTLVLVLITPLTAYYAFKNKYTKRVVSYGWIPIIAAMIISSFAGILLNKSMMLFTTIAAYQPVINGVGGNLVAIQASRLSTFLHQHTEPGTLPVEDPKVWTSPCAAFFTVKAHAKVAQILFLMAFPSHLLYLFVIVLIEGTTATFYFTAMYLSVALLQLLILLYLCRILVFWVWKHKMDPDDSSIPILTAIGDVLGVALLTFGFYFLRSLKDSIVQ